MGYVLIFIFAVVSFQKIYGERPANRNLPFAREVFRSSKHNGMDCSVFFTRASSTYEALDGRETVTHPWGGYNFKDAIASYQKYRSDLGLSFTNPIQALQGSDIYNDKDIPFDVLSNQRVFGLNFSYYKMFEGALSKATSGISMPKGARGFLSDVELYIGAEVPVMHASSNAHYALNLTSYSLDSVVRNMSVRDRAYVDEARRYFQQDDLGLSSNTWSATGFGDFHAYIGLGKKFNHKCRFRSMDFSAVIGVTIPTCEKFNIDRPLSFSFGSEGVTTHLDLLAELELKQGWRTGCSLGITSGYTSTEERRVPVSSEPHMLSPLKFSPRVKTGFTIATMPYFTYENIRPGFHATVRYTHVWHGEDGWYDERENPMVRSVFNRSEAGQAEAMAKLENWTSWSAAFLNLSLVYDPGQLSGKWLSYPLLWVSYDYPFNSDSVVRNRRLAVGVTLRF